MEISIQMQNISSDLKQNQSKSSDSNILPPPPPTTTPKNKKKLMMMNKDHTEFQKQEEICTVRQLRNIKTSVF